MNISKQFLKTVIVYLRGYGKEKDKTLSMTEQESLIRKYVELNGYRILEVFKEGSTSGKVFERSGVESMLNYIRINKRKTKFLIVADIKRLSTNQSELKRIRYFMKHNGIQIISIGEAFYKDLIKTVKKHF